MRFQHLLNFPCAGKAFCLLLVVTLCASCSTDPQPGAKSRDSNAASRAEPVSGHDRMVNLLEQMRAYSLVADEYFQTQTLQNAISVLEHQSSQLKPEELLQLHLEAAIDCRRLGMHREGIEHLAEAKRIYFGNPAFRNDEFEKELLFETALSWLRLGETENCVYCRTGESCILPIQNLGIHTEQTGSKEAIKSLLELLERDPENLSAQWLLNVASMTVGSYPLGVPEQFRVDPATFTSRTEFPRFRDVAKSVGVSTLSCGGGAVAEDFDGDGLIDLLTSTWDPGGQIRYFKNTGDGHFADLTEESGLTGILGGINMVPGDYDNDGLTDVYVMRGAWLPSNSPQPNSLLRNLGEGKFRDVTFDVGLEIAQSATSAAGWCDFDNDGDLDLYVPNEGPPAHLFRNDGEQGFRDIAKAAGVENLGFAKAVAWGDYDGDRWPDLYVSNLEGPNRLYHNEGNGTFRDVAPTLEVTGPNLSFPAWFWDVNNDGLLDLYVASYQVGVELIAAEMLGKPVESERDRLYLGVGGGRFQDAAKEFGLTQVTQPMGSNFGDLDNDGFPDFYLGTGYPGFQGLMPNLMFLNRSGERFENVTYPGGFGHLQKGHGTAFADFDNDGDQDVFQQMGGAYPSDAFTDVLYENPGFGRHWLRIKLIGQQSNRSAIGARIKVVIDEEGTERTIYKWVNSGGSFGASPLTPQIGLGNASRIVTLEIDWPTSGTTQEFYDVPLDRYLILSEGEEAFELQPLQTFEFSSEDGSS